ncbi:MAG: hypothetical protein CMO80_15715 [Verrucomicrobiales bacterium]|nr:hypothetical protein [Verrucomicrobiales bacterium]|tara:strand:- start:6555 stop:6752 length:198 start_codon:yes stop_codon:yes gene_type:complete
MPRREQLAVCVKLALNEPILLAGILEKKNIQWLFHAVEPNRNRTVTIKLPSEERYVYQRRCPKIR